MAPMDVDEEEAQPHEQMSRRGSMTEEEERFRRSEIKAILKDRNIGETDKRLSIQFLMDGRRNSMGGTSSRRTSGTGASGSFPDSADEGPTMSMAEADSGAGLGQLTGPPAIAAPVQPLPLSPYANTAAASFDPAICQSTEQSKRAEMTRPACSHYERNCSIVSPCCGAVFGCRICHDDCPVLPPKMEVNQGKRRYARSSSLPSSFTSMEPPEETHHEIDRFAIKEVICRECYTRQSSQT